MLALLAGFLLVGYLLAPGAIYRFIFSLFIPSKRFQRTRTEEIVFSVLITVLPFLLTLLVTRTPLGRFPALQRGNTKAIAYQYCLDVVAGQPALATHPSDEFIRAFFEQSRFLLYLWFFSGLEAWGAGLLVVRYGDFKTSDPRRRFCNKFLLQHVSEWHVLFSRMSLPSDDPRQEVIVDVLTTQGILYRGVLVNWFLDQDGKLAGIFLESAERFNKDDLKRDRDAGICEANEMYWRQIPGAKLYLPSSSIANYNIRYGVPVSDQEQEAVKLALNFESSVTITPLVEE